MTAFQTIIDELVKRRAHSQLVARRDYPCAQSRGIEFRYLVAGQTDPEPIAIKASRPRKKELDAALKAAKEAGADILYIEGGHDGGLDPKAFHNGDYDPWVSSFTIGINLDGTLAPEAQ